MQKADRSDKIIFQNWGKVDYQEAWSRQDDLFRATIKRKMENKATDSPQITENHLIFCEHPHVYTIGKSGSPSHLLINDEELKKIEATYVKIDRGGDITYHGPGQLVAYPIFDLDNFFTDLGRYLRTLEEAVILTLKDFGIASGRIPGMTGVWLDGDSAINARKVCAMGLRSSRWVTMHGLALNVNNDLGYFGHIVPCGIEGKAVTSISAELNRHIEMSEVAERLKKNISDVFGASIIEK